MDIVMGPAKLTAIDRYGVGGGADRAASSCNQSINDRLNILRVKATVGLGCVGQKESRSFFIPYRLGPLFDDGSIRRPSFAPLTLAANDSASWPNSKAARRTAQQSTAKHSTAGQRCHTGCNCPVHTPPLLYPVCSMLRSSPVRLHCFNCSCLFPARCSTELTLFALIFQAYRSSF